MADLGRSLPGEDRGQIILIAAFILAVSFVVLAVVVNSAIFTENLSTRDDVAGSQDALEYRAELKAGVENLVESVNENASLSHADVEDSVENMSTHSGLSQSRLGRVVDVNMAGTWEGGKRIAQDNASRNFTSNDSAEDWTVADGVDNTRNFVINVTNPSAVDFTVAANESSGPPEWVMDIDTSSGFTVRVETDSSGVIPECTRSSVGSHVTIDVTDATVDGEPCHALYRLQSTGDKMWFAEGLSDYAIEFEDGDDIEGTYSFVVDDGASITGDFHDSQNDDYPYTQDGDIIWSTTVEYVYLTSALAYETELEAAPGELPP